MYKCNIYIYIYYMLFINNKLHKTIYMYMKYAYFYKYNF